MFSQQRKKDGTDFMVKDQQRYLAGAGGPGEYRS